MSAQMPELGSKITLISKADIRYEGRLFTVDPQECTIALANVRSFGTEDRETQYPVPAQSQVYDYILFRGSDIKDIRVVQPQLPNDPAIVQLVPPMNQQPGYQNQAFNHPMGSSLSQYPGYGGMGGIPTGNLGLQRAPGPLIMQPSELGASGPAPGPPQSEGPPPLQSSNVPIGPLSIEKEQDLIGGVSRSTTPSITRKSPTNDQGTQVNNSPSRDDHKKPRPIQPPQRGGDRDGRSRRDQQLYQPGQGFQGNRNNYQQRDYQPRDHQSRDQYQRRGNRPHDNQQRDDKDQRDQMNQNRGGDRGWGPRGNSRQRGSRSRGPPKQFNRPGGPPPKKNTLKFDDDYDFDKANTEFEELRSRFVKVKIGNDANVVGNAAEGKVNGESEKKDDSGNETGAGENEQEEEVAPEPCYDKSKSFFDTISCEAVERSKGRSQRTDWRTERKLNSETFGVASARRGGFRGRGYYGGRGYNRPQGGFRPRGPPRNDRNSGQVDNKPQNAAEETSSSQKSVPVQGGTKPK